MKKKKRENLNLFFSAFLILGYIVCSYFFMTLASGLDAVPQMLITVAVFVVFGLLLFYATRVGDGEPIKRFSPIVLIVLVIPSFYVILAQIIPVLPLHDQITQASAVFILACIGFGYGIPYTFLSGFEIKFDEEEEEDTAEEIKPVAGGIKEELELMEDRDMDEPGLIEREPGDITVDESAPAEKTAEKETDPSELQPVEDRDMDESGLIDGEKSVNEAVSDAGDSAEELGLEPVEDRDMDEPELIGGEDN